MGFSLKKMFSGSGWKKFKGVVGTVAKVGLGVVPGVGGIAGQLLSSKLGKFGAKGVAAYKGARSTMQVLKASPVMPGGSIATPGGPMIAPTSGNPPSDYGSRRSGGGLTKRRKKKRTSSTTRRTTRKRKLKFGSPAWRKKYLKHRR